MADRQLQNAEVKVSLSTEAAEDDLDAMEDRIKDIDKKRKDDKDKDGKYLKGLREFEKAAVSKLSLRFGRDAVAGTKTAQTFGVIGTVAGMASDAAELITGLFSSAAKNAGLDDLSAGLNTAKAELAELRARVEQFMPSAEEAAQVAVDMYRVTGESVTGSEAFDIARAVYRMNVRQATVDRTLTNDKRVRQAELFGHFVKGLITGEAYK